MRENRRHPRYDVSEFPEFKAHTSKAPIGEKLMTVSIGGCGFWAPVDDFKYKLGERVEVQFQVDGIQDEALKLRGEVLYILPHPYEAQIGRFYGVKFSEESQDLVKDSIGQLELIYQEGKKKIKMA